MTEEDMELPTVEIINNNQLSIIIKETELSEDKSKILFSKFANFFSDAELWAKKAKAIKVTNENQKAIMDQARQGRLFLRKIRLDIENCRKDLKEQSLREGRAIDKVAKVLKEQIEPVEEYLDQQEHFIEYREAEKEALIQAEVAARMEEERLAEEKRKAEELAFLRKKNDEAEALLEKERKENEKKLKEAKENEERIKEDARRRVEAVESEIRLKRQSEMKAEADAIRKAEALKSASDVVKLQKFYDDLMAIEFPECVSHEAKRVIFDSKSHIGIAVMQTKKFIQSQQQEEEID